MACVKDKSSAACPAPGLGRRFGRVHPVGDQAITGFCIGDPLQGVFDDAHPDAIASLLTVLGTGIDGAEVGPIGQHLFSGQIQDATEAEQQSGTGSQALLPERVAIKIAIRRDQHRRIRVCHDGHCQSPLTLFVGTISA